LVEHLLKKLESAGPRRRKDVRPQWLTDLIGSAANLFEPFADLGRVGFEAQLCEDRWDVGLFLGAAEIVGGASDGAVEHIDFQVDVRALMGLFQSVERCRWLVFPCLQNEGTGHDGSFLEVVGSVNGQRVRMKLFNRAPLDLEPGVRLPNEP
jgi:hypothetical protein